MNLRKVLILFAVALVCLLFWRGDTTPRGVPRTMEDPRSRGVPQSAPRETADGVTEAPASRPPQLITSYRGPETDLVERRFLEGRVVWDDGQPVSGARLVLRSSPFDDFTRWIVGNDAVFRSAAASDKDGWFRVEWVRGGFFNLRVEAAHDPWRSALVRVPPIEEPFVIVVPRQGTELVVKLVRAGSGEPIPDTEVEVHLNDGHYVFVENTGPDGRARFRSTPAGPAQVLARPAAGEMISDHAIHIPGIVRIEIGRGLTVQGTVVDDVTELPIADAWFALQTAPRPWALDQRSDAQGRFEIDSLPWDRNVRRTLIVHAEGYAKWEGQIGHPDKDGATQQIQARMVRPATVRLRCIDGNGKPRRRVLVVVRSDRRIPNELVVASDMHSMRSSYDGWVEFFEIAPGETGSVTFWLHGALAHELTFAGLQASEVRELGEIVIEPPQELTGTVRTADGKPATGAMVAVEPHDPRDEQFHALANAVMAPRLGARVGADGRFRVRGLRPGSWDLLVHGGGHPRLLRVAIPVTEGKQTAPLRLQLPAAVPLRGRVVDGTGRGAGNVRVDFMRSRPVAGNLVESVTTDSDGRFAIPGFTRQDEDVPVWVNGNEHTVTPRDGPVEIRLPE